MQSHGQPHDEVCKDITEAHLKDKRVQVLEDSTLAEVAGPKAQDWRGVWAQIHIP